MSDPHSPEVVKVAASAPATSSHPPDAQIPETTKSRWSRRWAIVSLVLLFLGVLTLLNLTRTHALEEAKSAYVRRDFPACLRAALDVLNRRPWDRQAALLAARCLAQLDYADEAEPYFRRAGSLSLDDLQIRAFALAHGNHREKAIQAYNEILARWPDNVTALRRLAAVQLSQSNNDELLRLSERLIRIPNGAAIGYTLKGVVHQGNHDYGLAAEAFERVLALDPDLRSMPLPKTLFWSHLAEALISTGRVADARRHLTKVVDETPDATLMSLLGRVAQLEGSTDEAERCWRQAAEWAPQFAEPQLRLGELALRRGRDEEALEHLSRAAALAPRSYEILKDLATAYRKLGKAAEAGRLDLKAQEFRPGASSTPSPPAKTLPSYAL